MPASALSRESTWSGVTKQDAERDLDCLEESMRLQLIRRYYHQKYWHDESILAAAADEAEPGLKLENVAAHSWQVADACMIIGPHFPELDVDKCVRLATLHDKLEILTGDYDPVGQVGDGRDSHAFNPDKQRAKREAEFVALEDYLRTLRPGIQERQRSDLLECIELGSPEARFVKAIDRLQALLFVHLKKKGRISDDHLAFSVRYSRTCLEYFLPIRVHHSALLERLLRVVAQHRGTDRTTLDAEIASIL